MPMIIASIILGVLSATLVMLRINKREVEEMKDDEDGGVIVDMFMVEDESILHQSHNN